MISSDLSLDKHVVNVCLSFKIYEMSPLPLSSPRVTKTCSMSRAGMKGEVARTGRGGGAPPAVLSLTADVWDDCGKLTKDDVG